MESYALGVLRLAAVAEPLKAAWKKTPKAFDGIALHRGSPAG